MLRRSVHAGRRSSGSDIRRGRSAPNGRRIDVVFAEDGGIESCDGEHGTVSSVSEIDANLTTNRITPEAILYREFRLLGCWLGAGELRWDAELDFDSWVVCYFPIQSSHGFRIFRDVNGGSQ